MKAVNGSQFVLATSATGSGPLSGDCKKGTDASHFYLSSLRPSLRASVREALGSLFFNTSHSASLYTHSFVSTSTFNELPIVVTRKSFASLIPCPRALLDQRVDLRQQLVGPAFE